MFPILPPWQLIPKTLSLKYEGPRMQVKWEDVHQVRLKKKELKLKTGSSMVVVVGNVDVLQRELELRQIIHGIGQNKTVRKPSKEDAQK